MVWLNYPENKPNESGYYMTHYYNPEHDQVLYKALWFSIEYDLWSGPWKWNYDYGEEFISTDGHKCRPIIWKGIDVRKYQPGSKAQFYTQCNYIEDEE